MSDPAPLFFTGFLIGALGLLVTMAATLPPTPPDLAQRIFRPVPSVCVCQAPGS